MTDPVDSQERACTELEVARAEAPLAPTASRFGGNPYAEAGESWPTCASCERGLSFVAQLDLRATVVREPHVELFAFYYCWHCAPREHERDAWEIRSYLEPKDELAVALTPPDGVRSHPECRITLRAARSLPNAEHVTSVVGGYPRWLREDATPEDARFVAQLDSEPAAELTWGDGGAVFLFLSNDEPPAWWFVFQC